MLQYQLLAYYLSLLGIVNKFSKDKLFKMKNLNNSTKFTFPVTFGDLQRKKKFLRNLI